MDKRKILLTVLFTVCCCEARYQELPLVDTAGCPKVKLACDEKAKYRTYDGSCSSLEKPNAAKLGEPFVRVHAAQYADGISQPRQSVRGGELPPPRLLVTTLLPDHDVPDHLNTVNLMQFGQVLAADSSQRQDRKDKSGAVIPCCTEDYQMLPPGQASPDCMAFQVPAKDPVYKKYNIRCQSFVQCVNNNNNSCWKTPVEKTNGVSHVLDAHYGYGTTESLARALRTGVKGQLRTQLIFGKPFPPLTDKHSRDCPPDKAPENETFCFTTGDSRGNTNSQLTVYIITQLRMHNILCERLSEINPSWGDDTLYQESRKILGAVWQHFTYKHYLPIILGKDFMIKKGLLKPNSENCCTKYYDGNFNPSVAHEFNFAFRTFHSQIPRQMHFVDEKWQVYRKEDIDRYMMRSSLFKEEGVVDGLLRGLASQQAQAYDTHMSTSMREHLFRQNRPIGLDLISIDVQRSREFGTATYNEIRPLCGLKTARTFQDLSDVMSPESIRKLSQIYKDVADIDLYIGLLFERPVSGALTGPTAQCLVGEQFYNFLKGDRFYYENCGFPWSFTKAQLAAIHKTTLSWLWCLTGDNITTMTKNAFLVPSKSNAIVPCKEIPRLDLSPWKE